MQHQTISKYYYPASSFLELIESSRVRNATLVAHSHSELGKINNFTAKATFVTHNSRY